MLTAVDHVQLAAPPGSEDALRAYYVDILGMTEIPKPVVLAARGAAGSGRGRSSSTWASSPTSGPRRRPTRGCG